MNDLHFPSSNPLHLVLAPRTLRRKMMTTLTARLAQNGPVRVLDGGNSFDAYSLARQLRQHAGQWQAALERVSVARAFTCYQMAVLLDETALGEHDPRSLPTLVLDLLDTFYDENVALAERLRLLEGCLARLQGLGRVTQVAISANPPAPGQYDPLLERLAEFSGQVWHFELPQLAQQPALF